MVDWRGQRYWRDVLGRLVTLRIGEPRARADVSTHWKPAAMSANSFGARATLPVDDLSYDIYRLDAVDTAARLPYSLKVLLENLLRNEDGHLVTAEQVTALAAWEPTEPSDTEIGFTPARVLMQDFTGVPCVVDLVAMREAMTALGGDPSKINPLMPDGAGDRPFGDRRRLRPRRRLPDQRRSGVQPQQGALPTAAVGSAGLRRLLGGAPRHRHLPSGQPRVPGPGGVHPAELRRPAGLSGHPGRHRLAHPDGQRARACWAGASAGSRPRRPCSDSR